MVQLHHEKIYVNTKVPIQGLQYWQQRNKNKLVHILQNIKS